MPFEAVIACPVFLIWRGGSTPVLIYAFSTTWASLGLLLFRLVSSAALIWEALPNVCGGIVGPDSILQFLSALLGVFLAAGYRTRLAGGVTAAIEICLALFGDPLVRTLLATFAVGLALLGPGDWSVDARVAGWKRIEIPKRQP